MSKYYLVNNEKGITVPIEGEDVQFSIVAGIITTYEIFRAFDPESATNNQFLFNIWKQHVGETFDKIIVDHPNYSVEYNFNEPVIIEYLLSTYNETSSIQNAALVREAELVKRTKEAILFKERNV